MKNKVVNLVQKYRIKAGKTQEELASSTGVTRQTIIAIEKGNYIPSVLLALKISNYFDISVEKLFRIER